jgi:hypothetical protein
LKGKTDRGVFDVFIIFCNELKNIGAKTEPISESFIFV